MSDGQRIQTPAASDRPTFTILSEGTEIRPEYQVQSIGVQRDVNRLSCATIAILDGAPAVQDFPASNAAAFLPGKSIEIKAGYHSNEETVFKGVVVKQGIKTYENQSSVLTIECRDAAVKLAVGRKNKYFYESKDNEIIEEIINAAGLQGDVERTDVKHQEMVQFNATDWDFVVSRAEANGKLVYTEDGVIKVAAPDLSAQPALELLYGGNILDFEAEMDARFQYTGVHAFAWNAANQELLDMEGQAPGGTLPGNVSADDLANVVGLSNYELRHAGQIKDAELQAQANAHFLKSRLAKIRARVRIQGLGSLRPGQMIRLGGAGDHFNGPHFISGVFHEISAKNWETNIQLGLSETWYTYDYEDITVRPAAGLLPAVNGLQVGLVTALEGDPESEHRVQVRIPMIDPKEEGVWARVATLDAGNNRGSFFRPEIGDEVALGFFDNDPRNPVILGMMNSSAKPAPITAADDNHEKGWVTRSEIKIMINDDKKSVTVETPGGNKLILSDDAGGISMEDQNGNKIVLDSNGISIESAKDFKVKAGGDASLEGVNIKQSASASFKAEGKGGAEVSTSATAVLKGSIVQIN